MYDSNKIKSKKLKVESIEKAVLEKISKNHSLEKIRNKTLEQTNAEEKVVSGKGIFGLTLMKNFSNRELPSIGKV